MTVAPGPLLYIAGVAMGQGALHQLTRHDAASVSPDSCGYNSGVEESP